MHREVFFLAYHLHWSHAELMALEIPERQAFIKLLVEQIERENAALESSRNR